MFQEIASYSLKYERLPCHPDFDYLYSILYKLSIMDSNKSREEIVTIEAQLECFTLGQITLCTYDQQMNTIAILNSSNNLFLFKLGADRKQDPIKMGPFFQIQIEEESKMKKLGLLKLERGEEYIVVGQNNENVLSIWKLSSNLKMIYIKQAIDFIVNKEREIIICRKLGEANLDGFAVQKLLLKCQEIESTQLSQQLDPTQIHEQSHSVIQSSVLYTFKSCSSASQFPTLISPSTILYNHSIHSFGGDSENTLELPSLTQNGLIYRHRVLRVMDEQGGLGLIYVEDKVAENYPSQVITFFSQKSNIIETIQLNTFLEPHSKDHYFKSPFIAVQPIPNTKLFCLFAHHHSSTTLTIFQPASTQNLSESSNLHNRHTVISSIKVTGILNPLPIQFLHIPHSIALIDRQTHNIISIHTDRLSKMSLLVEKQIFIGGVYQRNSWEEQFQISEQTFKNLNMRMNSLKNLQGYISNYDIAAGFRFLQSSSNMAVLNDGLSMIAYKKLPNLHRESLFSNEQSFLSHYNTFFNLTGKLNESKYESHIQNSLTFFLILMKLLQKGNPSKLQPPEKREHKKLLQKFNKLIESKRINKLLQQEKKVRLFQLAYELKSMVLGYGKTIR